MLHAIQDKLNVQRHGKCRICSEIDPAAINTNCCDYLMCRSCLQKTEMNHPGCPNCRADRLTYFVDNIFLKYLEYITVTCQHQRDGCKWEGKTKRYLIHLSFQCRFADKICDTCRMDVFNKNKMFNVFDYVKTCNVNVCLNVQQCIQQSGDRSSNVVTGESRVFWIRDKFQCVLTYTWQRSNDFINIRVELTNLPHGLCSPKFNEYLKTLNVTATLMHQHNQEHNCLQVQMVYSKEQDVGCFRKDRFNKLGSTSVDYKCNQHVLFFHLSFQDSQVY